MKSQRESVFAAVCQVLSTTSFNGEVKLTSEQRKEVIDTVAHELNAGDVQLSEDARAKFDTFEKIKVYTSGLVSNWLRKDTRLNGGSKYEAKNPGSRAGQGDEMLKNLKALRSQLTDSAHIAAVDEKIAERTAEIATSKAKTVSIDINSIPEELRHLIPSAS